MAYVPPHIRSKAKQPVRSDQLKTVVKPIEDNFPAIGNGTQRPLWVGRKFADLATEWSNNDEQRKEDDSDRIKQSQIHDEDSERIKSQRHMVVLPRFKNIRKFDEPEDTAEVSPSSETTDGWKTIERKKQQKPKDLKEKTFEDYDKEVEKQEKQDETVWDVPEHQTCWDERY